MKLYVAQKNQQNMLETKSMSKRFFVNWHRLIRFNCLLLYLLNHISLFIGKLVQPLFQSKHVAHFGAEVLFLLCSQNDKMCSDFCVKHTNIHSLSILMMFFFFLYSTTKITTCNLKKYWTDCTFSGLLHHQNSLVVFFLYRFRGLTEARWEQLVTSADVFIT